MLMKSTQHNILKYLYNENNHLMSFVCSYHLDNYIFPIMEITFFNAMYGTRASYMETYGLLQSYIASAVEKHF